MRTGICLIIFLINGFYLLAQPEVVHGMEEILEYPEMPYSAIPLGDEGVLMYRQIMEEKKTDEVLWELLFYDTDFDLHWTSLIRTPYINDVMGSTYSGGMAYILFGGSKNFKRQLTIYQIELETNKVNEIEIKTFFPNEVSYFSIFNKTLIIGGKERSRPSFVFYNLINERPVILPGFYSKNLSVYDVSIDEENKLFTVVSGYRNENRQFAVNVRSYDDFGQPIEDERIDPREDYEFVHACGMIANHNMRMVSGVYQHRRSSDPEGIFLGSIHIDGERNETYYTFDELFFLRDSLHRENPDGAPPPIDPGKFKWYVSGMSEYGDTNLALIEAYKVEDRSSSLIKRTEKFYYPFSLIIGFNDDLEITRVDGLVMQQITSEEFRKNLYFNRNEEGMRIYYFNRNVLAGKIIDKQEGVAKRFTYSMIEILNGGETSDDYYNDLSGFRSWHENFYLYYGIKSGEDHDIYYIKKIYFPY